MCDTSRQQRPLPEERTSAQQQLLVLVAWWACFCAAGLALAGRKRRPLRSSCSLALTHLHRRAMAFTAEHSSLASPSPAPQAIHKNAAGGVCVTAELGHAGTRLSPHEIHSRSVPAEQAEDWPKQRHHAIMPRELRIPQGTFYGRAGKIAIKYGVLSACRKKLHVFGFATFCCPPTRPSPSSPSSPSSHWSPHINAPSPRQRDSTSRHHEGKKMGQRGKGGKRCGMC